jgi:hypothetical protein
MGRRKTPGQFVALRRELMPVVGEMVITLDKLPTWVRAAYPGTGAIPDHDPMTARALDAVNERLPNPEGLEHDGHSRAEYVRAVRAVGRRYTHLRDEYSQLTEGERSLPALDALDVEPAQVVGVGPAAGAATARVAEVLRKAWPALRAGAKALRRWARAMRRGKKVRTKPPKRGKRVRVRSRARDAATAAAGAAAGYGVGRARKAAGSWTLLFLLFALGHLTGRGSRA